ncbi:MAG TPA: hypothetical protein VHA05_01170 [Candidatus Saccharimonadales bacterium]|nr:hypothetical protein [Candidatus Saccharimonadales bacterium]
MGNPVIGSHFLVEDSEARHYHSAGLAIALDPESDFEEAIQNFEVADAILSTADPTIDSRVQLARVRRDEGFTMVRRGLVLKDQELMVIARSALVSSAELTLEAAGYTGELAYDPAGVPSAHGTRKHAHREIFAEHGATLGLLGRLTTAEAVLLDSTTSGDSEEAKQARLNDQAYYGAAHDFLRVGNNGYYLVSNAMCGARQEVLNGQRMGSNMWLLRAGRGLVWTVAHDRRNMHQALLTAGSRTRHLTSHDAARDSVFTKP